MTLDNSRQGKMVLAHGFVYKVALSFGPVIHGREDDPQRSPLFIYVSQMDKMLGPTGLTEEPMETEPSSNQTNALCTRIDLRKNHIL